MATEVKVPSLGESITSGILAAWHVKDGDIVQSGQVLYELETDKITSEGNAECSGKISIKAAEGDEVEIGQVIAEIDESVSAPASAEPKKEEPKAEEKETPKEEKAKEAVREPGREEETLSPAARKAAEETGIDLSKISGSGKGGRITKDDILKAAEGKAPEAKPAAAAKPAAPAGERQTRTKMSPLRKRIAERLVAAQHEAAMLTTFNEVDMSTVMKMRKKYQEKFVDKHGVKLGFMSFFVKASVFALQQIPQINAQIEGDELITNHFYDIGIAVGGPKGLMVPVVRDCDEKNFAEIEKDIIAYAGKIKEGKLSIDEMMGGVFTITNGGIYGSMLSTPILNAPQSAILGMHNIVERAVVVNGEIVVRPMMYLALSYDHRVVDGKEAVTCLKTIKDCIEDPSKLLFDI